MKKIIFNTILLFALCLMSVANSSYAQTTNGYTVQDISNIEKKGFNGAILNNRLAGNPSNTRTAASTNFDINYYRCEWEIDPAIRFIKGKVTSYFTVTTPADNVVFDLSDTLTVDSITYHGSPLVFQRIANDGLQIQFSGILTAGKKDSVSVYYKGVPRKLQSSFVQSAHIGVPVIWTLSEPFGAKEWWPCKNGLDDKADSIDIIMTNPSIYQASSNGVMAQESIINTNKVSIWKHRYPIASYLVAMSVTNFTVLKDSVLIGGKQMDFIDYIYPENVDYFKDSHIYTKQALQLFSRLFGDYPFAKEKYGYTQFMAGGGMEHQTNSFILNADISLLEHETAHQWFGDKITCGSWHDIWLNEGFATYCQVLFNQNVDTANYIPILKNITKGIVSVPNGSVYVPDTTDPSRIFSTRLSYYKGSFILRMLNWKLGDAVFFRAMNRYLNDPLLKYNYARTADFKRNMEQESGQDLTVFFQNWFYGEGFPNYRCTWTQNKNNWIQVQINQTTSHPSVSFYDLPVQLQFKNGTRDTLITVNNTQNGETFWINPGFVADTMFVDPNYWLLVKDRITQHLPAISTVENDIKIYPNPAPDYVNVSIRNPSASKIELHLYNIAGQLIYKTEKLLNGRDELYSIAFAHLSKGSYILCIYDSKKILQKKVIVK